MNRFSVYSFRQYLWTVIVDSYVFQSVNVLEN